jgi:hypothetical protein
MAQRWRGRTTAVILDTGSTFDDLLADFTAARSLSALDNAIIDHAIDNWAMGGLAKKYRTTATKLHRRRRQLFTQFRKYLEGRGISGTHNVFEK